MWQQLAMAGVKSLQENQNRKNDIASNVINQKYQPWTGAKADFSQQGKNNTMDNLMTGYGSGMLQDKLDAQNAAEKTAQEVAKQSASENADGDYYSKLSANPASVGVSAFENVAKQKSNPLEGVPSRAPALGGGNESQPFDLMGAVSGHQDPTPLMLQGQVPGAANPWMNLAKSQRIDGTQEPARLPSALDSSVWMRR